MPKFGLRFEDKRTGESSERIFEFSASEWEQLGQYLEHVRDLERTEFLQKGHGAKVGVSWKAGEGATWSVELPPEDSLFALLHRLRPLILVNEPSSFRRSELSWREESTTYSQGDCLT